jgi:ABC-type Zn uptake system ZnuABC Zn-binding protein ZnuA
VGDLAAQVAGDGVEVRTLLSAETDPHEYEPRPDDIEALAEADLAVASGGDLDEWVSGAVEDSGSDAELLVLAEHVALLDEDPHWWHDPQRVFQATHALARSIADLKDPDAEKLDAAGQDFISQLIGANRTIEHCIRSVPKKDRKLVTDHDAFRYLAWAYPIEIIGAVIPATTTEAQASAGELAELRDTIEREGVKAVFPEASVSSDVAETIAEETGASADHELYGDSLGPEGSGADTYLGMIRHNADALVRGFTGGARGCDA